MMAEHRAALLEEAVAALAPRAGGAYVDCTYGRGGHSQRLADSMGAEGLLLVIDRDPEAIKHAQRRFGGDARVRVQQGSFADLAAIAQRHELATVDGVLLDLGVSSPQLEDGRRGFSFSRPGPLDMRMDPTSGQSAADWLASASEWEIAQTLKVYGEERHARRLARRLLAARHEAPIATTERLAALVAAALPPGDGRRHPATRTFQAIRIQVNDELGALQACLAAAVELLAQGGRLAVISFHSLEDRLVKRFFRAMQQGEDLPEKLPIRDSEVPRRLRLVGKAVRASAAEVRANPRVRSSIMRVAEKVA